MSESAEKMVAWSRRDTTEAEAPSAEDHCAPLLFR